MFKTQLYALKLVRWLLLFVMFNKSVKLFLEVSSTLSCLPLTFTDLIQDPSKSTKIMSCLSPFHVESFKKVSLMFRD